MSKTISITAEQMNATRKQPKDLRTNKERRMVAPGTTKVSAKERKAARAKWIVAGAFNIKKGN